MPDDSALRRKLRGSMAAWDINAQLLRLIEFHLRGLQWQNAGGKTQSRPKPIELPDEKARKPRLTAAGGSLGERLRAAGMLPSGPTADSGR